MRKIGLIAMALVLALGALGVGFAAWTDTIIIEGQVNTGDVSLEIIGISHTDVYKDHATDECVMVHTATTIGGQGLYYSMGPCDTPLEQLNILPGAPQIPGSFELISFAHVTGVCQVTNTVTVEYFNLFPCIVFATDVLMEYTGSIPAKVNFDTFESPDQWLLDLVASGDIDSEAVRVTYTPPGPPITGETVDIGTQLHEDDLVLLVLGVHIPQDNTLMNKSGTATYTIGLIQWNEFGLTPP